MEVKSIEFPILLLKTYFHPLSLGEKRIRIPIQWRIERQVHLNKISIYYLGIPSYLCSSREIPSRDVLVFASAAKSP